MYDIISQIIDHTWTTGSTEQQYIYYVACVLICLYSVVFIDIIRQVFYGYIRRR